MKKTICSSIYVIIFGFSFAANANSLQRVIFDISNNKIPVNSHVVLAFIYETDEGYRPGVAMYESSSHGEKYKPFSTKLNSKFVSISHAEVEYNGSLHENYQIDPSCKNIEVLQDQGQYVNFYIDPQNKIVACLP